MGSTHGRGEAMTTVMDPEHYQPLVEIDGWLSACVVNHEGKTFLSVHRSAQLDDGHDDYEPVRRVLESGTWMQTSNHRVDDADTIGGVAVEVIYELAEIDRTVGATR